MDRGQAGRLIGGDPLGEALGHLAAGHLKRLAYRAISDAARAAGQGQSAAEWMAAVVERHGGDEQFEAMLRLAAEQMRRLGFWPWI
jgi:hypothetical protein